MLKNVMLVTTLTILSAALGFIAQIVVASTFGASAEMDLYFKILSVPATITGISPIIFSSVFIPMFAGFNSSQTELDEFIHSMWTNVLVFGLVFTLIGVFISFLAIDLFISINIPYLRQIGIQASLMVWIGSGFMILSSYLSAVLNYNRQFIRVAWTSLLPAFFMIIMVMSFHTTLGVLSLSSGFCIAALLQFSIFARASQISLTSLNLTTKKFPFKKRLMKQSLLAILSLLPFTMLAPIAYFWAAQLEVGSISYLGYSQSFAGFLSVAASMGIAVVSFPELADKFAEGKEQSSLYKLEQSLRYVLLISMCAAGAFIALRVPILTLFYQRGSFNVESVNNLASVVPWYLTAAIFIAGLNLIRNLFYSRGEFKAIARLGSVIPAIFFVLAGCLKESFSFVGIGMAYALTMMFLFFSTIHIVKDKKTNFLTHRFLAFFAKNAIAVIAISTLINFCFPLMLNLTSEVVAIALCFVLFIFGYFLVAKYVFKLEEINIISLLLIGNLK